MKLKIWELSLFGALVITILWGTLLDQGQQQLSDRIIRLHVLAHADDETHQALKYHIRDNVRALVEPLISEAPNREAAEAVITAHLDEIQSVAEQASASTSEALPIRAVLTRESSPTRTYETFTLPAGFYTALRIEIGKAGGQNWWCVVFPPLCLDAATGVSTPEDFGLEDRAVALLTGTGKDITIRFWVLERIEDLRAGFRQANSLAFSAQFLQFFT